MNIPTPIRLLCLALAFLVSINPLHAGSSEWTDLQGTTFKGEPSSVFGPFALFKTGPAKGRRVLFRQLSPEDCVRFYREVSKRPQAADDWSKARSSVSEDLRNNVNRLDKDKLVVANFAGQPEPELYLAFFGSSWGGESYELTNTIRSTYDRLRQLYGNRMEMVFFGVRHDDKGNANIAKATNMPWLVADYGAQSSIDLFTRFAPTEGQQLLLISRDGIPLAISKAEDTLAVKKFVDEVCAIMAAGDAFNPLFFQDRAYYENIIRPVKYATSSAPALLIGHPMRASALRKKNVNRITAILELDATGKVSSAELTNKDALPPAMVAPIGKALTANLVFTPAIEQGKPVASQFEFDYVVPDEKTAMEPDRDWVFLSARKDITIPVWLLLRPIPVPAMEFSKVDRVNTDGTMVLNPLVIGKNKITNKAQMNAFNADFFEGTDLDVFKPSVGQVQGIDEQSFTWESYESRDGFVDLRNKQNSDHSVGYAWAEFEVPTGGPAYFGIGSDDGVKIWLNGKLIHDRWIQRPSQIDQDIVPLQLKAGKNVILIKIQNASGDWSFFCRLRR